MESPDLRGIDIHTRGSPFVDNQQVAMDQVSSSGISSATPSIATIASNDNYANLPRKRNSSLDSGDLYFGSPLEGFEMANIRQIMAHMDGDRRGSCSIASSQRGSIEPSLMSTVFAVVLVIIISISVYAFASLYRAVMKRMSD